MGTGKKIGIAAFICAILYIVFGIIIITQAPEIGEEFYDLMLTDEEAANEMMIEIYSNTSTLFNIADLGFTIVGFLGIILAIISLVKMSSAKEKGKIFSVLSLVIIFIFYFVVMFSLVDFGAAFMAGLESGMEMAE